MGILGGGWLPVEVVAHAAVFLQQPMHGYTLGAFPFDFPVKGAHHHDLAVIGTAAEQVEGIVREGIAAGVRAFVVFS